MMKKTKFEKILYYVTLITLILSIIFVIARIITAPSSSEDPTIRVKSSYTLMLVQCILGVLALHLPDIIERRIKRDVPSPMVIIYIIFLYCAIYLGEVRNFYYTVANWDDILHTISGAMLGSLGFSVITLLNNTEKIPLDLSPLFVALFAFCFAVTMGVFWEFYEYSFDGLLGLNMQKFMLEDGTELVGRMALNDTMTDLFVDSVGAFIISVLGGLSLKYKTELINMFHFRRFKKGEEK